MIRLLYFALILFILFDTSNGLINGDLSGIGSGRGIDNRTITYNENPIEFAISIVTRIGGIVILILLLKDKPKE